MDKPFKFRRSREIAGAFILAALILVIAGVIMHGQVTGWFEPKYVFEVELPESGTQGVKKGAEVQILGIKVGTVKGVELRETKTNQRLTNYTNVSPDEVRIMAILEVRSGLGAFVGSESTASLKKGLLGVGSSFFEISRGHQKWPDEDRRELEFEDSEDVSDELTTTVRDIRDTAIPTIKEINLLVENLNDEEKSFQGAMSGIESLVKEINQGKGMVGTLIQNMDTQVNFEETMENLRKTSEDLAESMDGINKVVAHIEKGEGAAGRILKHEKTAAELEQTLANLNKASAELKAVLMSIDETAGELPGVIRTWNSGVEDIALVAKGLQNIWPIKKPVEKLKEEEKRAAEAARKPVSKPELKPKPAPSTKRKLVPHFKRR